MFYNDEQEFIHSVDELLALRTDIAQMKEDIVQLNSQIQVTGASLLDKVCVGIWRSSPLLFALCEFINIST